MKKQRARMVFGAALVLAMFGESMTDRLLASDNKTEQIVKVSEKVTESNGSDTSQIQTCE